MRLVKLGVLALLASCPLLAQSVYLDSAVDRVMAAYVEDTVEHVVCLFGTVNGEGYHVIDYSVPSTVVLTPRQILADTNPCENALGIWHNHVVPNDSSAWRYEYFSLTDQHTFLTTSNAMLAFVGVPGFVCFWTRLQVMQAWARGVLKADWDQCVAEWRAPHGQKAP